MRISTSSNITPDSSSPISAEQRQQYVWAGLAPRLIDPTRVAIIEALLQLEQPLATRDLAPIIGAPEELVRYHCKVLVQAGVLEIAEVRAWPGEGGDDSLFGLDQPDLPGCN
jgi:DNA-binding transcriptional ArsR family regulator